MNKATVPLLIIATGCGWLLSSNNVMPGVDWAWVLVFAVVGILSLVTQINKISVVFGPMMLLASVLMVLMQSQRISIEVAMPVLVIALGILMLISRFLKLPESQEDESAKEEKDE